MTPKQGGHADGMDNDTRADFPFRRRPCYGGMRIAPSSRITEPFMKVFRVT